MASPCGPSKLPLTPPHTTRTLHHTDSPRCRRDCRGLDATTGLQGVRRPASGGAGSGAIREKPRSHPKMTSTDPLLASCGSLASWDDDGINTRAVVSNGRSWVSAIPDAAPSRPLGRIEPDQLIRRPGRDDRLGSIAMRRRSITHAEPGPFGPISTTSVHDPAATPGSMSTQRATRLRPAPVPVPAVLDPPSDGHEPG